MNSLSQYIAAYTEYVLHLNAHLPALFSAYGAWVYLIVFVIIFLECGIILTPFLPGESLLFALGATAATGYLNVNLIALILIIAAVLGGFVNYAIGLALGKKLFLPDKPSSFKKHIQKHIKRTHVFYEKHGAMTIMIARLIPIIRTYAPFVAGMARMNFLLFFIYNIIGGIAWIVLFIYISFFFGNLPIIKQHFSLIILAIICVSVIPITIEIIRHIINNKKSRI